MNGTALSKLTRFGIGVSMLGLFTLLPVLGARLGMPWLSLLLSFAVVPVLDAWVGRTRSGAAALGLPRAVAGWLPRLQVPLQAVLLVQALLLLEALPAGQAVLLALSVGTVTGGIGITVAHELGHRACQLDRALSRLLLVSVGYGHFHVEHNRGHHARVATAHDPASAPRGMNVYRFAARSVIDGFVHARRLEAMRLAARGRPALHPANWVLTGSLASLALLAVAGLIFDVRAVAFLVGQAIWAVMLLEIVNYIEHYGLRRRTLANGRPEPVAPHHSWNADFAVSNWLLFNLQLHADHHAHADRPFEALRSMPQAPQLPAGYPTMVLAAVLPPLWFALMDQRLPASGEAVNSPA